MNKRTARLKEIMAEHELNAPAVGRLLDRSAQTVRIWRCEAKIIPEHTLAVLEQKVASGEHLKDAAGGAA
ncbi:TPA: hypothetical protein QDB21_005615 [Burkholderia vietnamiensis]|nr:hypothetical protein [Burkholderia vietnamiensis]